MKKKIFCLILATLMIIGSLPLSVVASGIEEISAAISGLSTDTGGGSGENGQLPVVQVSCQNFFEYEGRPEEFRFLPNDEGYFLIDITLDKAPEVDEDILVYYRTQDDSAVSKWGDYEAVSGGDGAYVTLNKANGYKARVVIKSLILDEGYGVYDSQHKTIMMDRIVTRRFRFSLMRVVGNALLPDEDPNGANDNNRNENFCYLRANRYHVQDEFAHGTIYGLGNMLVKTPINTPVISKSGSYSDNLNISFSEYRRNAVSAGLADVYVALNGSCKEDWWNSDGPATLHLYYTYQGKKYRALSLYIEGEFDDSTYYGWQHAFDYMNDNFTSDKYYGADVEDFMKDNFRGFTLYNNDGSKAFEVIMGKDRSSSDIIKVCEALKRACNEGYAVYNETGREYGVTRYWDIVHLKLPSNYVLADSYSYEFISEAEKDRQKRWLENVYVDFCFSDNLFPEIVEDDDGIQMITTNIDEMQEGDPLRVMIRFDRPVGNLQANLNLKINGTYSVSLKNIQLWGKVFNSFTGGYVNQDTFCWDTLVFEGYLPEDAKDIRITSITNIELTDPWSIRSAATYRSVQNPRIDSMYGLNKDMRLPVAAVSVSGTDDEWEKSKSVDINIHIDGNRMARFNDYATVYYQWSDSAQLPTTYTSKLTFHTDEDGEVLKTILGTGNGEMYLHIKTVSGYGRTSISDMVTRTYDPNDENATYTPFGPFKFDNAAPEMAAGYKSVSPSLTGQPIINTNTITTAVPQDDSGVKKMELYYIPHDSNTGDGELLKSFDIASGQSTVTHPITNTDVYVGVDQGGSPKADRQKIDFYWIASDNVGNTSDRTGKFSLVFDTNNYLNSTEFTAGTVDAFKKGFTTLDAENLSYIYDYSANGNTDPGTGFAFYFKVDRSKFAVKPEGEETAVDSGIYTVKVKYKGLELNASKYTCTEIDAEGLIVVRILKPMDSGRYSFQLSRTEGDNTRVSMEHTVYVTNGENDDTPGKTKIEAGTLLNNSVYQLSATDPYFYYKDAQGNICKEYYNGTKQPATFSSYSKAKEYVYYKELSDIYLIQLEAATAGALISGTAEYIIARGETVTPQAGQYWIRYKSESWTPTSGNSSWVYYYYGASDKLDERSLSLNLQAALNTVSNRIVGYGSATVLTDTSLFLGTAMGDKMLDENGMPYLVAGQIHDANETATHTRCGNAWAVSTQFLADANIYKSNVFVGIEGDASYGEYPIIGKFALDKDSYFQYMSYQQYNSNGVWNSLNVEQGQTFLDVLTGSGVYYIREISNTGIAVYGICIDKKAPKVSFYNTDDKGNLTEIPIDGVKLLDIRSKELYIGSIAAEEYDQLSYVAVYKVSNLELVDIYTMQELEGNPIKLMDGNYYIVVADRSGNHYTVTAKVSSSDLECQIKESTDKFIKLICNRSDKQILKYEVYRNGELVTSTYAAEQTFDKAGIYTIYIQDIYGNVFSEEYAFTRNYPVVDWKYCGADGKYHSYDPESSEINGFILTWVSDNEYKVSTSVKTRFSFSENYEFEFIGAAPEHTVSVGAETVVTIEQGQSFVLKVYYKNHKTCYTTYTGVVDVTPPSINVSAEIDELINGEYSLFESWLESGVISMKDVHFELSRITQRTVAKSSHISSDIIKIDASDANDLALLEVYLDGELFKHQDISSGFSQIVVSRWGSYRVVAKDTLGNVSEFTFTNGMPDVLSYSVDGEQKEIELHGYLHFETVGDKQVYSKVNYGNSNARLDIKENADVFISVGLVGTDAQICGYRISEGQIYPLSYKITIDRNGSKAVELIAGDMLLDINAEGFTHDKDYLLNADGVHPIYVSASQDKVISIKVYAPEDPTQVVAFSARAEFDGSTTMLVSSELAKKKSDISFKDLGVQTDTDIRANSGFTIDESKFENERVEGIELYYSKLNDFNENALEGRTNIYSTDKQYADEGFYLLVVRNYYGNEKVYRITISKSFGITSSVTFGDGHKLYYSKDYENTLYSNKEIVLDILDEGVTIEVTKSGATYTGYAQKQEGNITYLVFSDEGAYDVKLTDSYGNVVTRKLEISKSGFTVSDDLLTGYNEKALRREEGYTNQKLTIDKAVYERNEIYYLAIAYGETLKVLVDAFAEEPISADENELIDIIGAEGDGIYTVICRNRYGAMVTKEINYRSTPTLKLERTIRSKSEAEPYGLDHALSIGFWSNNTLSFSTDATKYVFTINGSATECPSTLVFENAGEYGSYEYDVAYIDEYGFEYSFKAYLVRREVTVEVPSSITGIEINGILNTRNDISITFGENIYATYTLNSGADVIYHSGEILKRDGTYKFTVIDYAGNATTTTIKKDTIVEFSFVESASGAIIGNGGVTNASKVEFNVLNKDSAYIEKVLHNGVVQDDFAESKFTKDGKWEIVLSDKLGNKEYFSFYLITHSQNGFAYTTPYEYIITEMWFDGGDGVAVSYMNFVIHDEFTSHFDFTENGKYTVVMTSKVTGASTTFRFTIDTTPPEVTLVGCNPGETTINDVTIAGCKVGDRVMIYIITDTGEVLIETIEVTSNATKMPTITEGGEYRIVVESEAGVATEFTFVRKHVMNTAGSIFIMVLIGLAVIGLFTGLIYRNKSKTDE